MTEDAKTALKTELERALMEQYVKGFREGITAFSWMKDGVTYVGTCGTTLNDALKAIDKTWNFNPPRL